MTKQIQVSSEIQPGDIVFNCPQCGKSLAIDPQGAGLVVTCPDCQTELQVPVAATESSEPTVLERLEHLSNQLARIEKGRSLDKERCELIGAEAALMQASLDRIVGIIQDALAPESPKSDSSDGS